MRKSKKAQLEAAGWTVGSTSELLELTPEEVGFVELELALARHVRALRSQQGLTQVQVARRVGSSQSRVAKMETADPTVSLDLLVRVLFLLGASRKEVARVIAARAA